MDAFELDPALFGVAGPSNTAAGRVRDIPKQLPLLSESESSVGDSTDEDETSSEDSGSGSGEDSSGSSEDDDDSGSEEEDSQRERAGPLATPATGAGRLTAAQKGKGREQRDVDTSGTLLPPLPTAQTDAESDYATDAGDMRRKLPDDELGRLISAIRNDSVEPIGSGSRGLLGQEWDKTMQQEMDEMDQEEEMSRAPSGQRRKPRKGRGRVAIGDQEPSAEIKAMLGSANLAYIHGNTKEAIDTLTEIIRIDPATKAAWYTLSTINDEQGNHVKALQLRIVPAHLSKSNSETWKELGVQSKDLGLLEQAVYCYTQALRADRHNVEAIWDRSILLRTTGKIRQAIMGFNNLLKLQPHNPNVIRELGPLYFQLKEIDAATAIYMAAYDHFRTKVPVPKTAAQIQGFGTEELEMLSDFLRSQRRYREAGKVITDGQRWLQGRIKEEGTWASFGDDREYDLQRKVRDGWAEHPQRWCEEAPTHSLVTGLRLRLGLCRLCEGRPEEARIHFDIIRQGDVVDYPEYYGEIADAYYERKLWSEAMEVYLDMSECEETNVPAVWIKIAQCQRQLGDLKGAAECYQAVVDSEPNDLEAKLALAEIYERLDERDKALDLVNEVLAQRRSARDASVVESASGSEYGENDSLPSGDEAYEPGPNEVQEDGKQLRRRRKQRSKSKTRRERPVHSSVKRIRTQEEREEEERQAQDEFDAALLKLKEVDRLLEESRANNAGTVDEALVQEWLEVAASLLDTFRTTKALFPSDGKKRFAGIFRTHKRKNKGQADVDEQANDIATRLQASLVDDDRPLDEPDANIEHNAYRGVTWDDWAKLAVRYAFMLTIIEEREEANDVLRHMSTSSMMRMDPPRYQLLVFGLAACAMWEDKYEEALEEFRKIIAARADESEPIRIFQAMCNSGLPSLDAIVNTKLQKYVLRRIKNFDQKALPSMTGGGADAEDSPAEEADAAMPNNASVFKPTKVNPIFLMFYGHIMACGKSYQSAIVYYLRAYDMRPDDPLVCLALALSYVHRAMQRQTDNRHYQLTQAIALLDQYRKHRPNEEEVQYNIGRVFHQLGVLDLAVKHYEKILERSDARRAGRAMDLDGDSTLDLSKEAAYNLSQIYFTRNAPELAKAVVDKYLSL